MLQVLFACFANPGANILLPRPGFPIYLSLAQYFDIEVRFYDLLVRARWKTLDPPGSEVVGCSILGRLLHAVSWILEVFHCGLNTVLLSTVQPDENQPNLFIATICRSVWSVAPLCFFFSVDFQSSPAFSLLKMHISLCLFCLSPHPVMPSLLSP